MDLITLGADAAVIGAIIGLTKVITSIDIKVHEEKYKDFSRFYPVIPAVIGAVAALFMTLPFEWHAYGRNLLIYVGTSTYLYKFGKTTVLGQ